MLFFFLTVPQLPFLTSFISLCAFQSGYKSMLLLSFWQWNRSGLGFVDPQIPSFHLASPCCWRGPVIQSPGGGWPGWEVARTCDEAPRASGRHKDGKETGFTKISLEEERQNRGEVKWTEIRVIGLKNRMQEDLWTRVLMTKSSMRWVGSRTEKQDERPKHQRMRPDKRKQIIRRESSCALVSQRETENERKHQQVD